MSDKKPITVVITCKIQQGKVDLAKGELQTIIRKVMLEEKACLDIRVHEDPDDNRKLLIIEHWDSKEIFLGPHMQTPHMKEFFKISESFLDGKTEFTFWNEIRMK